MIADAFLAIDHALGTDWEKTRVQSPAADAEAAICDASSPESRVRPHCLLVDNRTSWSKSESSAYSSRLVDAHVCFKLKKPNGAAFRVRLSVAGGPSMVLFCQASLICCL